MSSRMSYIEAIREAHRQEMRRDESVVLLGIDIGPLGGLFGATKTLHAEFGPSRVLEFPISETGYIGTGTGLAIEGFRPIIEIQMADFVTVALDQVMTVVSKEYAVTRGASSLPLVIRLPYGANLTGQGYMGGAGPAHSQSHEAWFCHSPGLTVVMPATPADALGLLKSAVRSPDPVIFMEQKGLYYAIDGDVPDGDHVVNIGEARVVTEGTDVTIVALGAMVHVAERVAEILAREDGASVEVVDPRTLVPLDEQTILGSVRKTGRLVIAHEAHRTGGFGGEIAAIAAEKAFGDLVAPVRRCAAKDVAIPAGTAALGVLPGVGDLTAAVREVLSYPSVRRGAGLDDYRKANA
jgi:acetoin:2,6-dichlorophenolindophenol oxidoreductase subunit beta